MDPNAVDIQMPTIPAAASQEEEPKKLQPQHQTAVAVTPAAVQRPALMSSASDLLKLLPTGTVLAFQALAPSFSNHGVCGHDDDASRYLLLSLIGACAASCVLLSFTDTVVGPDGRLYHGAATFWGFYPFGYDGATFGDTSRLRVTALDFVHAFFSALVFLAVALADAGVQGCLFPDAGPRVRVLLLNLPLGAGLLSSMVFIIFPTTRKSIGYADTTTPHECSNAVASPVATRPSA